MHVFLNPLRCKFYVRHTLAQKGEEKLLTADSKQNTKILLLQIQQILIFSPVHTYIYLYLSQINRQTSLRDATCVGYC